MSFVERFVFFQSVPLSDTGHIDGMLWARLVHYFCHMQDDFLQPTPVGEEVGVEDDEGGDSLPKKTKKHKHKKRSEAGEREGEGGVSHKKKHRSHHKSSRHRSLDQPDD